MQNYHPDWFTKANADDVRIQWPGPPHEVLETDPATGHQRPTEYFESHVTNPDHWSFGREVLAKYPELTEYGAKTWNE